MKTPLLRQFDPFVQLIVLLLIGFVSVALFIALGNALINVIWGIDVFTNLAVMTEFERPEVVHANKLLLLLQHLGLFVLPPLVFAQLVSTRAANYLSWRAPARPQHYIFAVLAMLLALLPINLLVSWNAALALPESMGWLESLIRSAEEQAAALTEALLADVSVTAVVVNVVLIAIVPAVGEELMFRGGIQRIITRWSRNAHVGIWVSAFLFSAMHFQFYGFLPRMALGALFGYMLLWSGSIWLPILAHLVNNATAIFVHFLIATERVSPAADSAGTEGGGIAISIVSAMLLGVLLWFWQRQSIWPRLKEQYFSA